MEDSSTYCGASSHHIICENYKFELKRPLIIFQQHEIFDNVLWLDIIKSRGDFSQETFKNVPHLETLNIIKSTINTIDEDTFSIFSNLKNIDIQNSCLPISNTVLKECNNLENLRLLSIKTKINFRRLFEGLIKLNNLYLYKLPKIQIESDTFLGLANLKYVLLQNCVVDNIPTDAFIPLKSLESLYIIKNSISELSPGNFYTLNDILKKLAINGNMSKCLDPLEIDYQQFENVLNLETISFPDIELRKLNFTKFHMLKTVQIIIGVNNDDIANFLTDKGIDFEWTTIFDISEEDVSDPNIQICA